MGRKSVQQMLNETPPECRKAFLAGYEAGIEETLLRIERHTESVRLTFDSNLLIMEQWTAHMAQQDAESGETP